MESEQSRPNQTSLMTKVDELDLSNLGIYQDVLDGIDIVDCRPK